MRNRKPPAIDLLQALADSLPLEASEESALDDSIQAVREEIQAYRALQAAVLEHLGPVSADETLDAHQLRMAATL